MAWRAGLSIVFATAAALAWPAAAQQPPAVDLALVVAVDACTNLASPIWTPLQTNTLTADTLYFSDPQWTNHPTRFYRLRSPVP